MSNSSYTAENIQHLETREAMRSRIQMYLGSDDTEGIYQALKEIINNSTDKIYTTNKKEKHSKYLTKELKNTIIFQLYFFRYVKKKSTDKRSI